MKVKILAAIVVLCLTTYFFIGKLFNPLNFENFKAQLSSVFESKASQALIQLRTLAWYDLTWSKETLNVNDTLIIAGKIYVPTSWPDTMAKPDSVLLNASITGIDIENPAFIVEKVFIGDQLITSPVRMELGKTYEFSIWLKAQRKGNWPLHALVKVKSGKQIYSPDKWVTINGSVDAAPVTFPLQTNVVANIKPVVMPEPTISAKIADAVYHFARRMQLSLTVTNHGDTAIRLGELTIAGMRFMDPKVAQDETGFPDNMLAGEGLFVDNSPLASGETRTVTLVAEGSEWIYLIASSYHNADITESYELADLNDDPGNRFTGLLIFYTVSGNRQIVPIESPFTIVHN